MTPTHDLYPEAEWKDATTSHCWVGARLINCKVVKSIKSTCVLMTVQNHRAVMVFTAAPYAVQSCIWMEGLTPKERHLPWRGRGLFPLHMFSRSRGPQDTAKWTQRHCCCKMTPFWVNRTVLAPRSCPWTHLLVQKPWNNHHPQRKDLGTHEQEERVFRRHILWIPRELMRPAESFLEPRAIHITCHKAPPSKLVAVSRIEPWTHGGEDVLASLSSAYQRKGGGSFEASASKPWSQLATPSGWQLPS